MESFKEWYSKANKDSLGSVSLEDCWAHQQAKIIDLHKQLEVENKSHTYHCKESQRKNDIIDKLERENKELSWDGALNEAEDKIKKLEKENREQRDIIMSRSNLTQDEAKGIIKALEFYADGNSHYDSKYEWDAHHEPERGQECVPSGSRAKIVLTKINY